MFCGNEHDFMVWAEFRKQTTEEVGLHSVSACTAINKIFSGGNIFCRFVRIILCNIKQFFDHIDNVVVEASPSNRFSASVYNEHSFHERDLIVANLLLVCHADTLYILDIQHIAQSFMALA